MNKEGHLGVVKNTQKPIDKTSLEKADSSPSNSTSPGKLRSTFVQN